jgi:hypothetical protein
MRNKSRKATPESVIPAVSSTIHKFAVGSYVTLIGKPDQALFKVTRQLPDGGAGLQYRIKSEREDYERVAVEPLLSHAHR